MAITIKFPSVTIGDRTIPERTLVEGNDFYFRSPITSSAKLTPESFLFGINIGNNEQLFADFAQTLGQQIVEVTID